MTRIAIVRLSALGDVTLLAAAVATLQRALPDAHITWITGAAAFQLLRGMPEVEFVVVDKPSRWRDYLAFGKRLADRRFDVLIAAQASLRANLLYPFISAPVKIGFDRRRARDGQWLFTNCRIAHRHREHLLESFLALLEPLGINKPEPRWNLPIGPNDHIWAEQALEGINGPLLAVNPAASKPERNWLPQRYVDLIRAAQSRWGAHVVITGGTAVNDRQLGAYITERITHDISDLIGKTTPKQLAALLAKVDCLVAPDTGPTHIAVAVGTPVIGLYAVAPAWLSGPYLYPDLVIDRYDEAVRRFLGQDPHRIGWGVRVRKGIPMSLIEVDAVIAKLACIMTRR